MTKGNLSSINYYRGIAIFLMLWGHAIQYCLPNSFDCFNNNAFKFIYSFHMPLFMLISGYLFRFSAEKRDLVELVTYKVKSLLYPLVMCSVLNYTITTVLVACIHGTIVSTELFGSVPLDSLWFLWSVLTSSVALSIAIKTSRNIIVQVGLIAVGVIIVALFPCSGMNIYMYPYFVIGYSFALFRDKLRDYGKIKKYTFIGSAIIFAVMLSQFKTQHYIYTTGLVGGSSLFESLTIDLFRWAVGLFGSITVLGLASALYNSSRFCHGPVTHFIESLGENSLAIYGLSVSLLSFYLPIIAEKIIFKLDLNESIFLYNYIFTPIIAISYSVGLLFIVKIMKHLKIYSLIFGR